MHSHIKLINFLKKFVYKLNLIKDSYYFTLFIAIILTLILLGISSAITNFSNAKKQFELSLIQIPNYTYDKLIKKHNINFTKPFSIFGSSNINVTKYNKYPNDRTPSAIDYLSKLNLYFNYSADPKINSSKLNITSKFESNNFLSFDIYQEKDNIYIDSKDIFKEGMFLPFKFKDGYRIALSEYDKKYIYSSLYSCISKNLPPSKFNKNSSYIYINNIKAPVYVLNTEISNFDLQNISLEILENIKNDEKLFNIIFFNFILIDNSKLEEEKSNFISYLDKLISQNKEDKYKYLNKPLTISIYIDKIFGSIKQLGVSIKDETNSYLSDSSFKIIDSTIDINSNIFKDNSLSYSLYSKLNIKGKNISSFKPVEVSTSGNLTQYTNEQKYISLYNLNSKLDQIGLEYITQPTLQKYESIIKSENEIKSLANTIQKTENLIPNNIAINQNTTTPNITNNAASTNVVSNTSTNTAVPKVVTQPKTTQSQSYTPPKQTTTVQPNTTVSQPAPKTTTPPVVSDPKSGKVIRLKRVKTGQIESIDMTDYIRGVLPSEMPPTYNQEAQKAQSVVARTFALNRINANKTGAYHRDCDLCDDPNHCQAYYSKDQLYSIWQSRGYDSTLRDRYWNNTINYVRATEGYAVSYGGQYIEAYFHANSGGRTESVSQIWSMKSIPYLVTVTSLGEENHIYYKSTQKFTYSNFESIVKQKIDSTYFLNDYKGNYVEILNYTVSGRVNTVKIGTKTVKATDIRTYFNLKSTNFTISYTPTEIIFNVVGYGHGVGMSQTGANYYAQIGKSYSDIIKHYYTGVSLIKAY